MYDKSTFIKSLIKDTLRLPLTDEKYASLGGSRNILYNCIIRDSPYIGDGCAETLKNIILDASKNNVLKKKLAIDFLKKYLSKSELEFASKYSYDIEILAKLAIQKFTHPSNKYFCSGNSNTIKPCTLKDKRIECINKVKKIITSIIEYIDVDINISFNLTEELVEEMSKHIIETTDSNIQLFVLI